MSTDKARAFTPAFIRKWAGLTALIAVLAAAIQAVVDILRQGAPDLPTLITWLVLVAVSGAVWLALRLRRLTF